MSISYPLDACTEPLPWQNAAWDSILGAMEQDRLSHALLISGLPGSGRGIFALALARLLLCMAPANGHNCGACKACELTRRGAHADFAELAPEDTGKSIGVDAVRAMLGFSMRTSSMGARKVILVEPLEAMTVSAFNAFLKALEEPAEGTYYLLVHARGRRVPATVRSRCQHVNLAAPDTAAACAWLECVLEPDGKSSEAADLLELAGGRPLRALEPDEVSSRDARHSLKQLLGAMQTSPGSVPQNTALAAAAVPPLHLLNQLQDTLHGMLRDSARQGTRATLRTHLGALDTIRSLRSALLSGCNPNVELLRFSALEAFSDACNGLSFDATLHAE